MRDDVERSAMNAGRSATAADVRVVLPHHLRTLARVSADVHVTVVGAVTQRSIIAALERRYPMLQGAIVDHVTGRRRPLIRFFVCQEDWSHQSPDDPVPEAVATGKEPFLILGAIAGG